MTYFEEFATAIGVEITIDENGMYTGYCRALALMVNDVIFSDDENITFDDLKKWFPKDFSRRSRIGRKDNHNQAAGRRPSRPQNRKEKENDKCTISKDS